MNLVDPHRSQTPSRRGRMKRSWKLAPQSAQLRRPAMRSTSASSSTSSSITWSSFRPRSASSRSSASAWARVRGYPSKIAPLAAAESSRSPISALTIASLTNWPAAITALASAPIGLPLATASRSMSPVDSWTIPRSAWRRVAWVPLPAPGGPSRTMFMGAESVIAGGPSAPLAGLELGLLDEVAVLVRDQMALDLRDRVHGHIDDDQQAGPAEIEGHARLAEEELGDQADEHQIGRAGDRDAGD